MHIIWKNIDSRTIDGLIIQSIPPITKPQMRVESIYIDGKDGDIIEELGYSSYEKKIKIGITKKNNINEIINYFNGSGELITSDELDKVYKCKIINQIDYERLLNFREATIVFYTQPFKYLKEDNFITTTNDSIEGVELFIPNASSSLTNTVYGNSIQEEPTPSTPKKIYNVVNTNLFNENIEIKSGYYNDSGTYQSSSTSSYTVTYIEVEPSTSYILSGLNKDEYDNYYTISRIYEYDSSKSFINRSSQVNSENITFTTKSNTKYIRFQLGTSTYNKYKNTVKLERSDISNNTYVSYGNWLVERIIGKNIFDGEIEIGRLDGTGNIMKEQNCIRSKNYVSVKPNTNYVISDDFSYQKIMFFYDKDKTFISSIDGVNGTLQFVTPNDCYYIKFRSSYSRVQNRLDDKYQIEQGTIKTYYEDYKENIIRTNLEGNELCKIGNVYDELDIINGTLTKKIGKVVFNGTENWIKSSSGTNTYELSYTNEIRTSSSDINVISNQYLGISMNDRTTSSKPIIYSDGTLIGCKNTPYTTLDSFKSSLSSSNLIVYYVLKTTQTIELESNPNIELYTPSYLKVESVTQPTNIKIDYVKQYIVNNQGLENCKPLIHIKGTGLIEFIANGNRYFSYTFDNDKEVYIDCEQEEAYLNNKLKNQNMNGDFPIFKSGNNEISCTGKVTFIEIKANSRWL